MMLSQQPEQGPPARQSDRREFRLIPNLEGVFPNSFPVPQVGVIAGQASPAEIKSNAALMSSSEPWKTFRYSYVECFERLGLARDRLWSLNFKDNRQEPSIGFFTIQPEFLGAPMLSLFCLDPSVRNQGIGSQVLSTIESFVFKKYKNFYLTVTDFNPAVRFYERNGYERQGEITHYNYKGSAEILMRKTTGPKREHLQGGFTQGPLVLPPPPPPDP